MPAVAQLRPRATTPPRSPERAALAEAIERHAAALDQVGRVEQAHEHADEVVYRAVDARKVAEAALGEAKANEPARLAAAALGEADGILSAAEAELAVTTATNDLAIARRTRDALNERAQRQAAEVERAKSKLDDAVADVMKAAVPVADLLKRAQKLQDELIAARIVLRHLLHAGWIAEAEAATVSSFLFRYGDALPGTFLNIIFEDWDLHPGAAAWRAVREELKRDPHAALPSS